MYLRQVSVRLRLGGYTGSIHPPYLIEKKNQFWHYNIKIYSNIKYIFCNYLPSKNPGLRVWILVRYSERKKTYFIAIYYLWFLSTKMIKHILFDKLTMTPFCSDTKCQRLVYCTRFLILQKYQLSIK